MRGRSYSQELALEIRKCGDLVAARRLHAQVSNGMFREDVYLGNLLVQMYGRCGRVEDARNVFDALPSHNIFSWTIVIQAYAGNGHIAQAKQLADLMPYKDLVACNILLAMHSQNGEIQKVMQIFDSLPLWDLTTWNTLVAAFASKGHLLESRKLFDEMPEKDIVSWNVMINTYMQAGLVEEAKGLILSMPETDVVTWNSMITAMLQAGDVLGAESVFDKMPFHDAVSFTLMITGYSQCGKLKEAKQMFERMPGKDSIAWNAYILALAVNNELDEAMELFEAIPQKDLALWNAMIKALSQQGRVDQARSLFHEMPDHNIISWSSLIAGLTQNGRPREAIELFKFMDLEGLTPNKVTFLSVLDACNTSSAHPEGRLIHEEIATAGLVHSVEICNELLGLYATAGDISQAKKIFDRMPSHDTVSWTNMIVACSEVKLPAEALMLSSLMALGGEQTSSATHVAILSACSHQGSVSSVMNCFAGMIDDFFVSPCMDHFKCVADVLARAGRVAEAKELIEFMPFEADDVAWTSLLSACRVAADEKLAGRSSERVLELDPHSVSSFVLLSDTLLKTN